MAVAVDTLEIEGKTKRVFRATEPGKGVFVAKDDITAGDGAKHDLIKDKAELATKTTCNVFRLLKTCGIPVAFDEQLDATSFCGSLCRMLPYEVVVRREAHGSYIKRNPRLTKCHLFPQLIVEFFLKTKDRQWQKHELPCDDPLMLQVSDPGSGIALYEPSKPVVVDKPFLVLKHSEVYTTPHEESLFGEMEKIARRVFLILEKAWQIEGRTLVDFKVEFGLNDSGQLLLADVIDNDSWRVLENGLYIDKQVYRDGGNLDDVAEKYRRVSEITSHFHLPSQQILIWCGSDKDDVSLVIKALDQMCGGHSGAARECLKIDVRVCSIHKEPIKGVNELQRLIQQKPNTVVIAYIGRSNGAGPVLSAATTVPVITIPANYKDFPEDVWSSLRAPSNVPVMTVLEPHNAAMAALEILALNNPLLYMFLREQLEPRLVNMVQL